MTLDEFLAANALAFHDRGLLLRAVTHRSYLNEAPEEEGAQDYERLEFLGDSILQFVCADFVFRRFPDEQEGFLTRTRAALVNTEACAAYARDMQLGEVLRLSRGDERTGGRTRQNVLADAFEAVAGALYLDQGLDAARAFLTGHFENRLAQVLSSVEDARVRLQELSQMQFGITPSYRTIDETGPSHAPTMTAEVLIGDVVAGSGQGSSKQLAARAAAATALETWDEVVQQVQAR
jgi:ribonuclease-3